MRPPLTAEQWETVVSWLPFAEQKARQMCRYDLDDAHDIAVDAMRDAVFVQDPSTMRRYIMHLLRCKVWARKKRMRCWDGAKLRMENFDWVDEDKEPSLQLPDETVDLVDVDDLIDYGVRPFNPKVGVILKAVVRGEERKDACRERGIKYKEVQNAIFKYKSDMRFRLARQLEIA